MQATIPQHPAPVLHSRDDHDSLAIYAIAEPPETRTLVDIFDATVKEHPDVVGLESSDGSLTYRQLSDAVSGRARALWDAGVRTGDRVGIRVPSGTADLYIGILAILYAGAAYVPVDWDDPDERAETVFTEADVVVVIGEGFEIIPWSTSPQTTDPDAEAQDGESRPSPSDDAWIIFTSGSTGKPKGVAVTHHSAAALVDAEAGLYLADSPLGRDDRVMAGLSVAFDASCEEMWLAWRNGATLVTAPRDTVRSGPDLGNWLVKNHITAISTVPTLASLWPVEALAGIRLLIFGGEACPLDLVVRLSSPGREIWNTYGPTEATVIACGALLTPQPPVSIGRPIPGWGLAVVDPETEMPVEWGETGELIISGVGLGRYLDPQKDAEKYAPLPALGLERAYRTGDMVIAHHEGIVFAGRTDDQIKLGGKRLELGEIDSHLAQMPGVNAGAAVVHKTNGGTDILVGYLTQSPNETINLAEVRSLMSERLPAGIAPILTIVDELPMKTSGKVDRKALPWPLPSDSQGGGSEQTDLSSTEAWLKGLWIDQLGPVPIGATTNFFESGGGSVQIARLVATIRSTHPAAEIGELYSHPTLETMASYIDSLTSDVRHRPMPSGLPLAPRVFQCLFVAAVYILNGIRYVVATIAVVWVLDVFVEAAWVPHVPFVPIALSVIIIFSTPGKLGQATLVCRALTWGIEPGEYRRGSWTHVRVWAAEHFLTFLRLEPLYGTRLARHFHNLLGNRVAKGAYVANMPPVTGLISIGANAVVEHEADLNGYWIEGDTFHIGTIDVHADARIGARTLLSPNTSVGARAEIRPGSHVNRHIPADELWGGSPIRYETAAGTSWPTQNDLDHRRSSKWSPPTLWAAEAFGLTWISMLPLLALLPGILIVLPQVVDITSFPIVAARLSLWVPLVAVLTAATWLALVIVSVRVLATWITPGYFHVDSATGWAVWLTHALLQRTLTSTYPIYASIATPVFLRLLGARVGKNAEISTIETIPHLTWLQDDTFIADHALVTSTRQYRGWVHIGTTVVGRGTFVGNSAIVGPDIDLPPQALVAVLSSTPPQAPVGTSWLGRTARPIPRTVISAEESLTYSPGRRMLAARAGVEVFRIVPFMITNWIELSLVVILNSLYMTVLTSTGSAATGIGAALVMAFPLTLAAGIVATLIAVAAKWALVGRFTERERPLFSSFVWRNELADVFAESLAVPSLIRLSIGSPVFNWYARLMGTHIGRHVWCDTWWLPEFDLVHLGDFVTVNRGTVLQTHLFQDRIMSMVKTQMERGSTLGVNSFLLPGSSAGERSLIGSASLILRDEHIPADTHWEGNPASFIDTDQEDRNE